MSTSKVITLDVMSLRIKVDDILIDFLLVEISNDVSYEQPFYPVFTLHQREKTNLYIFRRLTLKVPHVRFHLRRIIMS